MSVLCVSPAGHFGSGVVSYFVFLRWLFLVNLLCVVIWVSFVCVPQFVWRATPEGQQAFELSRQSRLTCLLDPNMYPAHSALSCPSNDTVYWYRYCQETNVTSYNVSLCEEGGVVWRSSPTRLVVSDLASCNLTQGNSSFVLCRNAQPPATFPLQYIVDFITGQGIFNVTVLFIGQYFNGFVGGVYDLPTAVLLTGGVVYVVFIVLIIARWVEPRTVYARTEELDLSSPVSASACAQDEFGIQPNQFQPQASACGLLQQGVLCLGLQHHRRQVCTAQESGHQDRAGGVWPRTACACVCFLDNHS